ncbi:MAG: VRR-NUC domain-containing protein [Paraprevotella sp.]|nr:VRR-NUC domain-containing protein [Paraprevotella sp.]
MKILESSVERYLDVQVRKRGGITRKLVYQGRRGAPDRMVLLEGRLFFVELKRPGEKPRPDQIAEMKVLEKFGQDTRVIDSREQVDAFLNGIEND